MAAIEGPEDINESIASCEIKWRQASIPRIHLMKELLEILHMKTIVFKSFEATTSSAPDHEANQQNDEVARK